MSDKVIQKPDWYDRIDEVCGDTIVSPEAKALMREMARELDRASQTDEESAE